VLHAGEQHESDLDPLVRQVDAALREAPRNLLTRNGFFIHSISIDQGLDYV
jgi:hypothetical protein